MSPSPLCSLHEKPVTPQQAVETRKGLYWEPADPEDSRLVPQNNHLVWAWTEKSMAPHSSTLAWKIPWMEEPGRLQSMGSRSRTRLSDFTFTFHFHALEKEMATHSSVLAWRIPGTGEPGGLPSMGLHRVGHNWSDLAAAAAAAAAALPLALKWGSEFLYHTLQKNAVKKKHASFRGKNITEWNRLSRDILRKQKKKFKTLLNFSCYLIFISS